MRYNDNFRTKLSSSFKWTLYLINPTLNQEDLIWLSYLLIKHDSFEWFVIRCGSKNGHEDFISLLIYLFLKKKKIERHPQNLITTLNSIVNAIRGSIWISLKIKKESTHALLIFKTTSRKVRYWIQFLLTRHSRFPNAI